MDSHRYQKLFKYLNQLFQVVRDTDKLPCAEKIHSTRLLIAPIYFSLFLEPF